MTAHRNYDAPPLNLAVLLSGSGRTLDNLLERIAAQKLYAKVNLVISSREDVRGVVLAQKAGLRTIVSSPKGRDRSAWSCDIFNLCRDAGANIVVLAGFLHLLEIPSEFESRVLNIHPSLLPAFGEKVCGACTCIERSLKVGRESQDAPFIWSIINMTMGRFSIRK